MLALSLTTQAQEAEQPEGLLPLEDLRLFVKVFDHIRQGYVEDIDDRTLLENAIKGMLTNLDPHSGYLDASSYEDLQLNTTGEFGGLGIEVGMENGFVKVIAPIDGTPAAKAGVEAGDLIIRLDDKPVKGMDLDEAVNLMRGPKGSDITLTIVREGRDRPFELVIERDIIQVQSVRSRTLEPGYGYLRVAQFQVRTGQDVIEAIKELRADNPQLHGLVLDLRNNPGGVLQSSVEVADAFLDSGNIVYTEGRIENAELSFDAQAGDMLPNVPVVVLINDGSASAAEIVAGALQDHQRAVVMGTQSFGKGSVQTVIPITEDKAIKLTTALYFTPSGRSIQANGIEPDIVVERAKITAVDSGPKMAEADLSGHLSNRDGEETNGEQKAKAADQQKRLMQDNQLFEALNLLKGLHVVSAGKRAAANSPTESNGERNTSASSEDNAAP